MEQMSYEQLDKSESYRDRNYKSETPISYSEKLHFWCNDNIVNYINVSKLVQIVNQIDQHKERFKFLAIKYDEERD